MILIKILVESNINNNDLELNENEKTTREMFKKNINIKFNEMLKLPIEKQNKETLK